MKELEWECITISPPLFFFFAAIISFFLFFLLIKFDIENQTLGVDAHRISACYFLFFHMHNAFIWNIFLPFHKERKRASRKKNEINFADCDTQIFDICICRWINVFFLPRNSRCFFSSLDVNIMNCSFAQNSFFPFFCFSAMQFQNSPKKQPK